MLHVSVPAASIRGCKSNISNTAVGLACNNNLYVHVSVLTDHRQVTYKTKNNGNTTCAQFMSGVTFIFYNLLEGHTKKCFICVA